MKKLLTVLLSLLMAASLMACGGTTEPDIAEQPKEPVVVEVDITEDNLLDYFELYEEPWSLKTTDMSKMPTDTDPFAYRDNQFVEEQYWDSTVPYGFMTRIKLKDEYTDQLDFNDENVLTLSYVWVTGTYRITGDAAAKEYGEKVTDAEWNYAKYEPDVAKILLESDQEMGKIDSDGYYYSPVHTDLTIADKDLTSGTMIYWETFSYRNVTNPQTRTGYDIISEGPLFITKLESLEWTNVTGKLYLHQ